MNKPLSTSIIDTPRWLALVPAGLSLLLYLLTCSPTLNSTDSGELITVAWTRGIAHPSGYPLYTLLGIGAIHLPIGDIAWRLNMLSAIFASVAIGFFYLLVTDTLSNLLTSRLSSASTPKETRPRSTPASARPSSSSPQSKRQSPPSSIQVPEAKTPRIPEPQSTPINWIAVAGGLSASALLAVSLTFWNWATQAKFYTLHYALTAALLWLALRARRDIAAVFASGERTSPRWPISGWPPPVRTLHLLALILGLALTNHFLTLLLLPGIALLLFSPRRYATLMWRTILHHVGTLLLAFLLPLLLYLYLPIRASMNPTIEWGLPDSLANFWRHVTAQSYQGFFGSADLGNHLLDALIYAANQFGPWLGLILLLFMALGIAHLWRTDRGLLAATAAIAIVHLVVVLNYNIREIVTYYVPLYMILLWWAGLGIAQAAAWLESRLAPNNDQPLATRSRSPQQPALPLALGALLALAGLAVNWASAGHRNNYTAELFVRNAFNTYGQNAVVLTNYWDLTSGSFYFQNVLNERRDVAIIDKSLMRQPFYLEYLERTYPDLINRNIGPFSTYKGLLNQWIQTGQTPEHLQDAYLAALNGFIETNLGLKPVYADFVVAGGDAQEAQEITLLLQNRKDQLVPNGFGTRIAVSATDLKAQDPQFNLRGLITDKVPLDEIEASVMSLYPSSLQSIGLYLQKSSDQSDKDAGARMLDQAQQLSWLTQRQDARPVLR